MPIRMQAHEAGALAVAQWLETDATDFGVERVLYPGLESHPQHALARRQMENMSGMISFCVRGGKEAARRFARDVEVIHYAVSLGHHRSLIYYIDTEEILASSYQLSAVEADKYRSVAGTGLFRLSIGLEDAADIIDDLKKVLEGIA